MSVNGDLRKGQLVKKMCRCVAKWKWEKDGADVLRGGEILRVVAVLSRRLIDDKDYKLLHVSAYRSYLSGSRNSSI